MGQGQSQGSGASTFYTGGGAAPHHSNQPPLRFNSRHGDNCSILRDGSQAKRGDSFCKGIVFSDRPVEVGERVCIRLTELSIRWSGVLRLGFTSHNPLNIQTLPKYACPDLTGKPGYWAKALAERYAESNALIHFYCTPNGDVHFGVNGSDKGLFFSGVDTRHPIWCMLDLYGNCTAIEMVDMRRSLNNFVTGGRSSAALEADEVEAEAAEEVANSLNSLELGDEEAEDSNEVEVPLRFNSTAIFRPLSFHAATGPNINLNGCSTIAWRQEDEYSNGYVFTAQPLVLGDRVVTQVLATENMYIGSLAFGLTSCDPASLDTDSLPEDSDMLLDRPEYWVVSKDVANTPDVGDELSFSVNGDGTVEFSKNGAIPSIFMHVDSSVPLWAFWDVYGNTQRLRMVGATQAPVVRADQVRQDSSASRENDRNNRSMTDLVEEILPHSSTPPVVPPRSRSSHAFSSPSPGLRALVPDPTPPEAEEGGSPEVQGAEARLQGAEGRLQGAGGVEGRPEGRSDECKICYESPVDCVLYMCGHMCLCYECALQQWKGRGGGICPMCREVIQDVIKTYRS